MLTKHITLSTGYRIVIYHWTHYPSSEKPGPCVFRTGYPLTAGLIWQIVVWLSICALFYLWKYIFWQTVLVVGDFLNGIIKLCCWPAVDRLGNAAYLNHCCVAIVILLWVGALSLSPFSFFAVSWPLPRGPYPPFQYCLLTSQGNFTLDCVMKELIYFFRNQFFLTFTRDKKQLKFVLVSIRVSSLPEWTSKLLYSRVSIVWGDSYI